MRQVRVYRMKWWFRASSIIAFALGATFAIKTWGAAITREGEPSFLWPVASLVLLAAGIVWVLDAFGSRVMLSDDRIDVRGLRGRKGLALNAIRGRRTYLVRGMAPDGGGNTTRLKVIPDDDRLPELDFQRDYNFDAAFYEWFHGLSDLDAMDKERKPNNFGLG